MAMVTLGHDRNTAYLDIVKIVEETKINRLQSVLCPKPSCSRPRNGARGTSISVVVVRVRFAAHSCPVNSCRSFASSPLLSEHSLFCIRRGCCFLLSCSCSLRIRSRRALPSSWALLCCACLQCSFSRCCVLRSCIVADATVAASIYGG